MTTISLRTNCEPDEILNIYTLSPDDSHRLGIVPASDKVGFELFEQRRVDIENNSLTACSYLTRNNPLILWGLCSPLPLQPPVIESIADSLSPRRDAQLAVEGTQVG